MTRTHLKCGYLPLVDCAPLVIAHELGFAHEEGVDLTLVAQPSWSALRDMLALGQLDAAQMLSPLPVAMSLGLGGLSARIDALMVLSVNGTVFGVARPLAQAMRDAGWPSRFGDPSDTARFLTAAGRRLRIGVPFPYSMHRLLLDYWLADRPELRDMDLDIVTVPPPRMADAVAEGRLDAFWVGEPWGTVAVARGVAELVLPGRAIWAFAPEKVLAARHAWVRENPHSVRALMRAVYQAGRWLDQESNKSLASEILARSRHLNLPDSAIEPAITNRLSPSLEAGSVPVDDFLLFHKHAANFPWRSQASWIASRLGATAGGLAAAREVFRADLYRDNLGAAGVDLPGASEKIEGSLSLPTAVPSTRGEMILGPDAFFDGKTFDFPTGA